MEAVVKYAKGSGNVGLREMPQPIPREDQVLLEIACCGICGTDLHVYHDTFKNYPPVILGHEFSGKVVEVGKAVKGVAVDGSFLHILTCPYHSSPCLLQLSCMLFALCTISFVLN